jgi:hypothetical protein
MGSRTVRYTKYSPDMEYHCSKETEYDNTVMNRQVDAYVKKL